jgi:dTDP-4-amino-4,6-dideoxygalactose transaminase
MMDTNPIPFNKPSLTGKEIGNIQAAIQNGHLSGDGVFSKKSQEVLMQVLRTQMK